MRICSSSQPRSDVGVKVPPLREYLHEICADFLVIRVGNQQVADPRPGDDLFGSSLERQSTYKSAKDYVPCVVAEALLVPAAVHREKLALCGGKCVAGLCRRDGFL